jgi:soluble lytic murein transglycosylase-like protein
MAWWGNAAAVVMTLAIAGGTAEADLWSRTDADGVVHFTNLRPSGKGGWRRLSGEDASVGKAAARRGDCARCDAVPARDHDRVRFARYDAFISEAAALYVIPEPLIRAVIKVESDYDPRVVSSVGARGLMQLMPAVVKDMGVREVHDPRENILGGTRLLRILANRYQGDLVKTIAAYHAGPGSLARYGDNVPPHDKTPQYLRMVLDQYYRFKAATQGQAAR